MFDISELRLDVVASENEDWDFARNKQVLLKSPLGEWSSSVFSAGLDFNREHFAGPNRDYSHQGLLISMGLQVFKTLDSLFFAGTGGSGGRVVGRPDRVLYRYPALQAEFALSSEGLLVNLDKEGVAVLPLIDIREMNQHSNPEAHSAEIRGNFLFVKKGDQVLKMGPLESVDKIDSTMEWIYKHGSGFRWRDEKGYIRFIGERRRLYLPGIFKIKGSALTIELEGAVNKTDRPSINWLSRAIVFEPTLSQPMLLRLCTLQNFGLDINGTWFPEAGCWWFRKPWVRDALEGILSNFKIYTSLFGWTEKLRALAILLLKMLEKDGTLPIEVGSGESSADAPPLLLYLCSMLDRDTFLKAFELSESLLDDMKVRDCIQGGPPVLRDGLVACAPSQSWTDSRLGEERRPTRIPDDWRMSRGDWESPKYFLPEVNGYWIRAIGALNARATRSGLGIPSTLAETQQSLENAFRKTLWDGTCAANIVEAEGGKRDKEITSMGLVGIASAIRIFSRDEINNAYEAAKRLLVNRRLVELGEGSHTFGIMITKHTSPYLSDADYHRSVAWPRDTPYLIDIMDYLGLNDALHNLLVNVLDQSISESALMYTSEIFGLPTGKNPNPSDHSRNVIPLKNPAQYWSHWCDPFIDRIFRII